MARTKQTPFERKITSALGGMNTTTKSQLKKIEKISTDKQLPQVPTCTFYVRFNGTWKNKGISCRLCGVLLSTEKILDKHRYICSVLNKKKEFDDMPIHKITRGGRTYYKYGETGKEYPTREQAEKQAAAIKASQAREEAKKK